MCTAISMVGAHHLFGRTLDIECSYGEAAVITPRNFRLDFRREGVSPSHLAMVGMAAVKEGMPLYYDAVNEAGLAMAALKFPNNAVYHEPRSGAHNIASFEFILWILCQCESLKGAIRLIRDVNITPDSFSEGLPSSPLHFMIADRTGSLTVESVAEGLKIYENPLGVLTNNPPFPYQMTRVRDFMGLSSKYPENTLTADAQLLPYSGGMGAIGLPGDFSSCSRFARAVFAKNHTQSVDEPTGEISRFFHVMDTVGVPLGCEINIDGRSLSTVYTSCADTNALTYYFTTYTCRRIKAVSLVGAELDGEELAVYGMTGTEDIDYLV